MQYNFFQISEIRKKHKNVSRQTYNFLEVKLRRLREQISFPLPTALITAGPGEQYSKQDNSGNRTDLTYKNLSRHDLTAQFYLKLLLIKQHEVPFMSTSQKCRVTEQRMANVQMSRTVFNQELLIQLTPFYTFFSNLPDDKNGFSVDARSPPEVKLTPQNLQMLFV